MGGPVKNRSIPATVPEPREKIHASAKLRTLAARASHPEGEPVPVPLAKDPKHVVRRHALFDQRVCHLEGGRVLLFATGPRVEFADVGQGELARRDKSVSEVLAGP